MASVADSPKPGTMRTVMALPSEIHFGEAQFSEYVSQDLVRINIKMDIANETPGRGRRDQLTDVESKALDDIRDIRRFKIIHHTPIIDRTFNDESALVRRHVKRDPTHGARRVTPTRAFPTVQTLGVKFVTAIEFSICLRRDLVQTNGTLGAAMVPTPIVLGRDFGSARGPMGRLGPAPMIHT